jgi:hypothetical protein
MSVNRATLELLELGDRALPSPIVLQPLDPPVALAAVVQSAAHPLHGFGAGRYRTPEVSIDAGTSFTLTGTAYLNGLGNFHVTGQVNGVGMIASGRATGELVLTNAHGTITLTLHGPTQQAFSPIPRELVYVVSGGTGSYSHLSGYGTVGIALSPAPVAVGHPQTGSIALTFS